MATPFLIFTTSLLTPRHSAPTSLFHQPKIMKQIFPSILLKVMAFPICFILLLAIGFFYANSILLLFDSLTSILNHSAHQADRYLLSLSH
jgi:hypothetical protein